MRFLRFVPVVTISWSIGVLGVAIDPSPLALHEKREASHGWMKKSAAPQDLVLPIHIGVASRNAHLGHDILMDISDPNSQNFGRHWTPDQIKDFFSPDSDTVDKIKSWLSDAGIDESRHKVSKSRGSLQFIATVAEAEALLGTQYEIYEDSEGEVFVSCDSYHVPKNLQQHVDFVSPTIGFTGSNTIPGLRKRSVDLLPSPAISDRPLEMTKPLNAAEALRNCADSVTPACVQALYGIPENHESVPGNDLGIYELESRYNFPDLYAFFEKFAPRIPNGTHPILQSIDGAKGPTKKFNPSGGEALLDIELAYPIIYPQPMKLYQNVDGLRSTEDFAGAFNIFLDALDASYCTYKGGDNSTFDPTFPRKHWNQTEMCGEFKPTNVISISYGQNEDFASPAYEARQCHEYMKLGLQGTSIVFSSGDNGAAGRFPTGGCMAGGRYRTHFPATCPYVTSVGATMIKPGASIYEPEVAAFQNRSGLFTSGGGFSNTFAQPSYQKDAVSAYLQGADLPPASVYNAKGRGYPDVSANGVNITMVESGMVIWRGGTSAAAPIFASIINRINGERIKKGKKSVGFLNPILYQHPEAFNDITEGYNTGCKGEKAFSTSKGWDPVTGLGTPSYERLLEVFMKLP